MYCWNFENIYINNVDYFNECIIEKNVFAFVSRRNQQCNYNSRIVCIYSHIISIFNKILREVETRYQIHDGRIKPHYIYRVHSRHVCISVHWKINEERYSKVSCGNQEQLHKSLKRLLSQSASAGFHLIQRAVHHICVTQ